MPPLSTVKHAASAAALGFSDAAPLAAKPRMAASAVGESGSKAALAQLKAAMAEMKMAAAMPLLQQGVAALAVDDFQTCGALAIQVLEADETNGFAWYLLAISRERAGDFGASIRCYESALSLLPNQAEIANDLGRLAYRMDMKETAEKLFRHYLVSFPLSHEAANNLACALRDQSRFEEAIDALKPVLMANPELPLLWNTLGTVMAEQGDVPASVTFFNEALRLDSHFAKARYNRGNATLMLGDAVAALEDCETALLEPVPPEERTMMILSRATILPVLGRVAEGWEDYEARLDPTFGESVTFLVDRPRWTPEADLIGKTLLVFCEQGLGDEIMFTNVIPDVLEALGPDGKLILAVERRLVPLFQRSFPNALVGAHSNWHLEARVGRNAPFVEDMSVVDLWTPIGSLLRRFRRTAEAFPSRDRFLTPDPDRVEHWRAQLAALPGVKVGILWKSMIVNSARGRFFTPFDQWREVLSTPGCTFVNLQYGDCEPEIEQARNELGVEIWTPPGIDLKQDLDDVAALCAAVDLVVGPSNATICIAGAVGAPLWLICAVNSWTMVGTDRYPWYPQARVFLRPGAGDRDACMGEIAQALSSTVASGTKAAVAG